LPEPIPRQSTSVTSSVCPLAARVLQRMAGQTPVPPRSAAPPPAPMREPAPMSQPVPPRSTPGRSEAGAPGGQAGVGNVQAGALASASSSGGAMGHKGEIGSNLSQPARVHAGGSSSQPTRFSDR
jgi:hypothetical protein